MSDLDALRAQLERIATLAAGPLPSAPGVSAWSAAQHLDHVLRVGTGMLKRIAKPSEEAMPPLDWRGRLVLTLGWIPRGKGKSPDALVGQEVTSDALAASHRRCAEALQIVADRPVLLAARAPVMRHPYFGGLTAAQTVRFARIHTDHHLKIVGEILAAASGRTVRPG